MLSTARQWALYLLVAAIAATLSIAASAATTPAPAPAVNDSTYIELTQMKPVTGPDGVCKQVTNNATKGLTIFVPANSTTEWEDFIAHPEPGVTLADCGGCKGTVRFTIGGGTYNYPYSVSVGQTQSVVWPGAVQGNSVWYAETAVVSCAVGNVSSVTAPYNQLTCSGLVCKFITLTFITVIPST